MENYNYGKITPFKNHSVRNQFGFTMIIACLIMPLILMLGLLLHALILQIEIKSSLKQLCRTELIKTQLDSSSFLQQLLRTSDQSPKTRKLSGAIEFLSSNSLLEHASSQLTSKSNLSTSLNNAELLRLFSNQPKQKLVQIKTKMYHLFQKYKLNAQPIIQLNLLQLEEITHSVPSIEIKSETLDSKKVQFILKKDFESLQSIAIKWKYTFNLYPDFNNLGFGSQTIIDHCSATLRKEKPWLPVQYEDRFYWKPS